VVSNLRLVHVALADAVLRAAVGRKSADDRRL